MARTLQELKDANARVDAATNVIGAQAGQVAVNERAQIAEIHALKDALAAGTAVTAADLDSLVEGSEARATALETIQANMVEVAKDPNNPLPVPDPIELPPVVV